MYSMTASSFFGLSSELTSHRRGADNGVSAGESGLLIDPSCFELVFDGVSDD
jgi:hypothetical protein